MRESNRIKVKKIFNIKLYFFVIICLFINNISFCQSDTNFRRDLYIPISDSTFENYMHIKIEKIITNDTDKNFFSVYVEMIRHPWFYQQPTFILNISVNANATIFVTDKSNSLKYLLYSGNLKQGKYLLSFTQDSNKEYIESTNKYLILNFIIKGLENPYTNEDFFKTQIKFKYF